MSEFNLSENIVERDYFDCGEEVIGIDWVKEFIRLLKEEVNKFKEDGEDIEIKDKTFNFIVDKLAGDKLVESKQ